MGYGAIIDLMKLPIPIPEWLSLISQKHKRYTKPGWQVFTIKHQPQDTLYNHLVFALKYEGINLLFFKKLFEQLPPSAIEEWIKSEPLSIYSRKIWFLYEWLMQRKLSVSDLKEGNYIPLIDEKLQYASQVSLNSIRHRIKNNLPGTFNFCPLVYKTEKLEKYLKMLGLWERRHEPAGTFSKGMRQKLVIARALLHEPKVLFLDEPTSGLDPEAAKLVRDFSGSLKRKGRTIFMCTHNLAEADQLCDRIAVFNTRLLALDTPSALRKQLYGRAVVFHLSQEGVQYATAVEKFPFVRKVDFVDNKLVITLDEPEGQNPMLVRALVEAGADIQFVGEIRHSLEDVYLQLVKNGETKETA